MNFVFFDYPPWNNQFVFRKMMLKLTEFASFYCIEEDVQIA